MTPRLDLNARKAQLAEAVWQVILDHGITAVSVRSVADQAGVVVGSLRHVFPTRAELMQFSAELMLQRATERVLAVQRTDDPEIYALRVVEQLLPLTADSRAELEVNLALAAESTAVPGLVTFKDEAHEQLGEVALRMAELLADSTRESQDVRVCAQRLHALIDGLAFHLLHRSINEDPAWAVNILRDEISTIRAKFSARD